MTPLGFPVVPEVYTSVRHEPGFCDATRFITSVPWASVPRVRNSYQVKIGFPRRTFSKLSLVSQTTNALTVLEEFQKVRYFSR